MSESAPWMKFYPQDWRADEKLRLCSLAARGLWIEMLALMHRSERYGQLLISGRVPTDAQLAVQVGASPDEVTAMLAELSDAGVFSRAASGAIYSRRMTRDHKKAENARKNGKKGGNPSLGNKKGKSASDKGGLSQPLNSEARGQRPEEANASSAREPGNHENEGIDLADLTSKISTIAGVPISDWGDAARSQAIVQGWLDAGADPDFLTQTVTSRKSTTRSTPKSLQWFDGAVREAISKRRDASSALSEATGSIIDRVLGRSAA